VNAIRLRTRVNNAQVCSLWVSDGWDWPLTLKIPPNWSVLKYIRAAELSISSCCHPVLPLSPGFCDCVEEKSSTPLFHEHCLSHKPFQRVWRREESVPAPRVHPKMDLKTGKMPTSIPPSLSRQSQSHECPCPCFIPFNLNKNFTF